MDSFYFWLRISVYKKWLWKSVSIINSWPVVCVSMQTCLYCKIRVSCTFLQCLFTHKILLLAPLEMLVMLVCPKVYIQNWIESQFFNTMEQCGDLLSVFLCYVMLCLMVTVRNSIWIALCALIKILISKRDFGCAQKSWVYKHIPAVSLCCGSFKKALFQQAHHNYLSTGICWYHIDSEACLSVLSEITGSSREKKLHSCFFNINLQEIAS